MNIRQAKQVLALATILTALAAGIPVSGADYYWGGGVIDITDGTPIPTGTSAPSGVWDTTIKNWATNAAGTAYVAWPNTGADTAVFQNLVGNSVAAVPVITQTVDITVGKLVANITNVTGNSYGSGYKITATNSRTITLSGDAPEIAVMAGPTWASDNTRILDLDSNIKLAGTKGFTKTGYFGGGVIIRGDASGLTGTITSMDGNIGNGSVIVYGSSANLRGISLFDMRAGSLAIKGVASGNNDQIGDSAVIRCAGRDYAWVGVRFDHSGFLYDSAAGSREMFKRISLDPFGSLIFQTGDGTGQLILSDATAGIDRGRDGHGTALITTAAGGVLKTTVVVSNGIPTGVVIPWMATTLGQPLRLSPSNTLETVPMTYASQDLSTWGGNEYYTISNSVFSPVNYVTNGAVIGTLGVNGPNSGTAVITIGTTETDTLTIKSGVIGYNPLGGNGVVFTNGSLTSGTNELNIFTGTSTANGSIAMYSRITGNIALTISGKKDVTLYAANTHTGGTYVNNC